MQTGAPGEGCLHPDRQGDGACIPTGRGTVPAARQAGEGYLQPYRQGDGACIPTGRAPLLSEAPSPDLSPTL